MEKPAYALDVFTKHFQHFRRSGNGARQGSFTVLELGPGESLLTVPIAYAHGANLTYLIDVGKFADYDAESYKELAELLAQRGLSLPNKVPSSAEELLETCHGCYLVCGLESLRSVPTGSVDFAFSHAVLEHVKRGEFLDLMLELRRVLKPDGLSSHIVDLRDHLGGALNHLRFPSYLWESKIFLSSGFYTNRLRFSEMLAVFREAGFETQLVYVQRWPSLPIERGKIAKEFRCLREDDLLVYGFHAVLRPLKC
jgi:SAM-dependent methyltransferase